MTMTNEEIVRHYNQAANKSKDITVLAELNLTTKNVIRRILADAGAIPAPAPTVETRQNSPYESIEVILDAIASGESYAARQAAAKLCQTLFHEYLVARLQLTSEGGKLT